MNNNIFSVIEDLTIKNLQDLSEIWVISIPQVQSTKQFTVMVQMRMNIRALVWILGQLGIPEDKTVAILAKNATQLPRITYYADQCHRQPSFNELSRKNDNMRGTGTHTSTSPKRYCKEFQMQLAIRSCYHKQKLFRLCFFSHPEGGVGQTQAWMPTYVSILRIPQMI
jgi:hypothetical protein